LGWVTTEMQTRQGRSSTLPLLTMDSEFAFGPHSLLTALKTMLRAFAASTATEATLLPF
jgi:hypothetical protein